MSFFSIAVLLAGQAPPPQGEPEEIPLSVRVNHAIALGVEHLKSRQQGDGTYRAHQGKHPGGSTALVAYTLVKSGVRRNDPALRSALAALAGQRFETVYSASVHLLLCEALRGPEWASAAEPSLDFLIDQQDQGVWSYPWGQVDNSNTQFALLALGAARRLGLEVPEGVWIEAADGLKVFEHPDGGFTYAAGHKDAYAGITAAGLASLAVLQEVAAGSARLRAALERRASARERAERWLERRWDPTRNAFDDGSWWSTMHFAYLWAVERWCGLTGRERLAGRDWYREGAEWLLSIQARDGSFGRERQLEDTCFALLFLRRATFSAAEELDALYAEIDRQRLERPDQPPDPGPEALRLTDWWLAGPWPQSGSEPILLAPPFAPKDLEPLGRGRIARREWEPVRLQADAWTDLEVLTGREGKQQLWLLATRLAVQGGESLELMLWLELAAGWDVWLDGQSLSRERRRTLAGVEDWVCPLVLAPGEHLLAVLVEDRKGPSAFGARLTGRDNGAPPARLVVAPHPAERASK